LVLIALAVLWWVQQDSSIQPVKVVMPIEEKVANNQQQAEQLLQQPAVTEVEQQDVPSGEEEMSSGEEIATQNEQLEQLSEQDTDSSSVDLPSTETQQAIQTQPPADEIQIEAVQTSSESQQQQLSVDSAQFESNSPTQVSNTETAETTNIAELEQAPIAANLEVTDEPVQLVFSAEDYVGMQLSFSRDCWVKLSDATGEDIAYGIKATGYVMNVAGVPPIEVTLCAPEFVQIIYNGKDVDMSQFRQARTAKFQLPLTSD
jgi:cytoskeleton protein RodZ